MRESLFGAKPKRDEHGFIVEPDERDHKTAFDCDADHRQVIEIIQAHGFTAADYPERIDWQTWRHIQMAISQDRDRWRYTARNMR